MKLGALTGVFILPPLAPDDFAPKCEMNGLADYMSNTFCSSSLCDARVEHSANTRVCVYIHDMGS